MAKSQPTKRQRQAARRRAARLAWVGVGVLTLVLLGGLRQWLADPQRFPLRVVEVSGSLEHLDRAMLEARVATAVSGGFFASDLRRLRDAVTELPWVARVGVRRRWPDRLHLHIEEHRALARWGEAALLSEAGVVFRPADLRPVSASERTALPQLFGPAGSVARVLAFYRQSGDTLAAVGLTPQRLGLDARREWRLVTADGIELRLGAVQPATRLRRFVTLFPMLSQTAARYPERVDLRYAQGLAVRWRERAPATPEQPAGQQPESLNGRRGDV